LKKVITYLRPYTRRMLCGFIIKVLGTLMDLGLPWVLAYIIDEIIPIRKVLLIVWWGVIMLFLSLGARSFNVVANRMAAKVARNATEKLRHDLFDKILNFSGSQMDHFTIPTLEARMTTDTYNIHNMIGMMQRMGVRAPIILIGGIIITSTLEPVLTLVLLGVLPFLGLVVYFVSKKGIPLYSKQQISVDHMVRIIRENITGIRVIKALSKTQYEKNTNLCQCHNSNRFPDYDDRNITDTGLGDAVHDTTFDFVYPLYVQKSTTAVSEEVSEAW